MKYKSLFLIAPIHDSSVLLANLLLPAVPPSEVIPAASVCDYTALQMAGHLQMYYIGYCSVWREQDALYKKAY